MEVHGSCSSSTVECQSVDSITGIFYSQQMLDLRVLNISQVAILSFSETSHWKTVYSQRSPAACSVKLHFPKLWLPELNPLIARFRLRPKSCRPGPPARKPARTGLKRGPAGLLFSLHSTDGATTFLFVVNIVLIFLLHCVLIGVV